jgi:DNA mismatch repair protein MutL
LEVRFADSGRLYSQLLGTLRTKFLTVDLNTKGALGRAQGIGTGGSEFGRGTDPNLAADDRQSLRQREELVAWAKGELTEKNDRRWPEISGRDGSASGRKPLELVRIDRPLPARVADNAAEVTGRNTRQESLPQGAPQAKREDAGSDAPWRDDNQETRDQQRPESASSVPSMQVHNRYLIAESDEGVVVIDQHALHERILYEQIRQRVLAGALEVQRLLVPEAVDFSPAEAAAALANQELLAKLGVEVTAFGGDTILVTSYPAMLANFRPAEVLHDLVGRLLAEGKQPERRDMVDELLHMIACKAAIKAGDRLSPDEVAALVEMRHLAKDSHHCPHGRPTALVFTREELDRQFLRT